MCAEYARSVSQSEFNDWFQQCTSTERGRETIDLTSDESIARSLSGYESSDDSLDSVGGYASDESHWVHQSPVRAARSVSAPSIKQERKQG